MTNRWGGADGTHPAYLDGPRRYGYVQEQNLGLLWDDAGDLAIASESTMFLVRRALVSPHSHWFSAKNEAQSRTRRPYSLPQHIAFFRLECGEDVFGEVTVAPLRRLLQRALGEPPHDPRAPTTTELAATLVLARRYRFDDVYAQVALEIIPHYPDSPSVWHQMEAPPPFNLLAILLWEAKAIPLLPIALYFCARQPLHELMNNSRIRGSTLPHDLLVSVLIARSRLTVQALGAWANIKKVLGCLDGERLKVAQAFDAQLTNDAVADEIVDVFDLVEASRAGYLDELGCCRDCSELLEETIERETEAMWTNLATTFQFNGSTTYTSSSAIDALNHADRPYLWGLCF